MIKEIYSDEKFDLLLQFSEIFKAEKNRDDYMITRKKRELYQDCTGVKYDLLTGCFVGSVIEFDRDTKNPIKLLDGCEIESRVWLLFASCDKKDWECVQVGHSKNEVRAEVEYILRHYQKNYADYNNDDISLSNSLFYKDVCPRIKGIEYREGLYSKIGSEYKYFRIAFLNVNLYLKISDSENSANDAERIIEICKNQYAEAKIAYETQAVYWRQYKSGIDGQTIDYIANHSTEFLRKWK